MRNSRTMNLSVSVESPSKVSRKLKITVPPETVDRYFQSGLVEVQKNAKVKGFRPGHVPLNMVRQVYGDDIRDKVFHALVDDSVRSAISEQKLRTVGRPMVQTEEEANHKHEEGEHHHHGAHDHAKAVREGFPLTFFATVDLWPEIELKKTTGFKIQRLKVQADDKDIEQVIGNLQDSRAELIPVVTTDRKAKEKDFVDFTFQGSVLGPDGPTPVESLKGNRVVELGSGALIPGFEDNITGLSRGESKTFKVSYPADFQDKDLASKDAEFTITLNEIKEKKLPELTPELLKELGYESMEQLRDLAKQSVLKNREELSHRKVRSDILSQLIQSNPFELPLSLLQAQIRSLVDELAQDLQQQKHSDDSIQKVLEAEWDNIKHRAEGQVRASLLIEAVAEKEGITISGDDIAAEYKRIADELKRDLAEVRGFYEQTDEASRERKGQLEYRLRERKTFDLILGQSKVTEVDRLEDTTKNKSGSEVG